MATEKKAQPGKSAGKAVRQPEPRRDDEILDPTPQEIDGPYFRLGAPERSDLVESDFEGDVLNLTGRVLTPKGTPIPDAVVQLWTSDEDGNYDMVGYRYHGWQRTDAEGRYQFRTIVPACYEPRDARHLHVKVQGDSSPVTTQLYVDGEEGNEDDAFFHPDLVIYWEGPKEDRHGTFDFVIRQVTERENVTPASLAGRVD